MTPPAAAAGRAFAAAPLVPSGRAGCGDPTTHQLEGGVMALELIRMSKKNITRLFGAAILAFALGLVLGVAALWSALASTRSISAAATSST